ncbi:hypothetical protein HanPI659440_Chr03g0104531 [Helianthus annuus]|nr:hypothetical protein HanPI659440_Chr03g0104531 [Helianthus annuus]
MYTRVCARMTATSCATARGPTGVMRHYAQTHQGHAPACHVTKHLVLASLTPPRARGQKYKGGSQAARGDASEMQSAPSKRHIAPHRARHARARVCELGCFAPFASTLSECFHETIRMESSHLNTPLSFISPPMWDNVPLSHFFQHSSFKHQTLSIDISFILAPFWTWFSLLRSSSNIEHKPTNKYIKPAHFILFISCPK